MNPNSINPDHKEAVRSGSAMFVISTITKDLVPKVLMWTAEEMQSKFENLYHTSIHVL